MTTDGCVAATIILTLSIAISAVICAAVVHVFWNLMLVSWIGANLQPLSFWQCAALGTAISIVVGWLRPGVANANA